MMISNSFVFFVFTISLSLGMLIFLELGYRVGTFRLKDDPTNGLDGTIIVESAIFAVWGLLLAFTFSGAASRFDMRRTLVGVEANTISTAYLRLDLLSTKFSSPMKDLVHAYIDSRIDIYKTHAESASVDQRIVKSNELQAKIWQLARKACEESPSQVSMLLLPSLNSMFDITTTRLVASQTHPPTVVYFLIFLVSLCCSLLIGFKQASLKYRNWLHNISFVLIATMIFYVILDMEFPRLGLIRVDAIDQVLVELKKNLQ